MAECIGQQSIAAGHRSWIAYGRTANPSQSTLIRIGSTFATLYHVGISRTLDRQGLASSRATRRFIAELSCIKPDIVHLHNLHGYYLNYEILFSFIRDRQIPIVWTLHDCWAFTGHCTYFDSVACDKWRTGCGKCPLLCDYPRALAVDNSAGNFRRKASAFTAVDSLHIVTPSLWLAGLAKGSYLRKFPVSVIRYGIDLGLFKPQNEVKSTQLVLGVAKPWSSRKGLDDFIALRRLLPNPVKIVLIGLTQRQIRRLPDGITGITATESAEKLAAWYSRATVFVNPTYADNFPVVNLEALACGTPVVTYNTGGGPEAITAGTGAVVPRGNVEQLCEATTRFLAPNAATSELARNYAEVHFDSYTNNSKYLSLYESLLE